jgi:hypothetical protein
MRGSIHVAFEEGTQAQWLHDLLAPVVSRVIVCDRRGEHRGNKADQVDADKLSHRLLTGDLRAVYHGSSDRLTLQELTRTYMNLVEDSTRTMLRLKSLFRARAIRAPGTRIYGPKDRRLWLDRLRTVGARFRAETLYAELDVLRELRPRAKALMVAEARRDPAYGAALDPLPGAGPRFAAAGHHEDTVALPDQAEPLGLCRSRGRHRVERRSRVHRRPSRARAASRSRAASTRTTIAC